MKTEIQKNQAKDLHCFAYFKDGVCPMFRWQTNYCPLNIGKARFSKYCCMAKQGKKGGIKKEEPQGDRTLPV